MCLKLSEVQRLKYMPQKQLKLTPGVVEVLPIDTQGHSKFISAMTDAMKDSQIYLNELCLRNHTGTDHTGMWLGAQKKEE